MVRAILHYFVMLMLQRDDQLSVGGSMNRFFAVGAVPECKLVNKGVCTFNGLFHGRLTWQVQR